MMAPTRPEAPNSTPNASSGKTENATTRWRPVLRLYIPRDISSEPASTPDSSWLTDPHTYLGASPGGNGLWFPPLAPYTTRIASRPTAPANSARHVSRKTAKKSVDTPPHPGRGVLPEKILPSQTGTIDKPTSISNNSSQLNRVAIRLREDVMKTDPLRPQPEPRCTASDCPIFSIHSQGTYLWQNEPPSKGLINDVFKPSNPPPCVLAAYELSQNPISSDEFDEQAKIWKGFYKHHTRPV